MRPDHAEVFKANLNLKLYILNQVFIDNKYTLFLISLESLSGNISRINMFYKDLPLRYAINMTLDTLAQLDFKVSIYEVTAINDNHRKQF